MYLKEFDLDLHYRPDPNVIAKIMAQHQCEYHEATKLDYQENWKNKRRAFRLQTRCITSMFERLLGSSTVKTKRFWKLLVQSGSDESGTGGVKIVGDTAEVDVVFSLGDFFVLSDLDKKRRALDLLMEGIEKAAAAEDWDLEPFRRVYELIRDSNYKNEWIWRKSGNRAKTYNAEILCNHGVDEIDIFLLVANSAGDVISKQLIVSELPDEFAYARHLGKLEWRSNTEVVLVNKSGDAIGTVCLWD